MVDICPKCHEKIKGNETYCPFCSEFLGDKSDQEVYKGSPRMGQYVGWLYCGVCVLTLILFLVIGGFWWW